MFSGEQIVGIHTLRLADTTALFIAGSHRPDSHTVRASSRNRTGDPFLTMEVLYR